MKYILMSFLIGITFCVYSQRELNKSIKSNVINVPITKADFIKQTLNPPWKVKATTHKNAKIAAVKANCSCQVALSVSEITLKAERENAEKVKLIWKATEQTNDHKFGIERSIDAKAFTNIDYLISKNSAFEIEYSYEDTNDNQAVTYYRIKENDLSGKVIYSNIVAVLGAEGEGKIIISPNPSADKISVSLVSESNSNGSFTIFTVSGSQVLQKAVLFEKGKNITTIDISELAIGTYFLQINNGKNKVTKKVVKR